MSDHHPLVVDIKPRHDSTSPQREGRDPIETLYSKEDLKNSNSLSHWELFKKKKERNNEEEVPDTHAKPEDNPNPFSPRKRTVLYINIAIGLGCLLVVWYVATVLLPRATITVHAQQTIKSLTSAATASTAVHEIDTQNQTIPAKVFTLTRTLTKEYTTTKETSTQKARGSITIYNNYSTSPQRLIATTRFLSLDGKLFRLDTGITVPGAKLVGGKLVPNFIDAHVTADQPGASFNIAPTTFTIPGFKGSARYEGFYGKSTQTMSGGSEGNIQAVNANDIQHAKTDIINSVQTVLNTELTEKSKGYIFLNGATDYTLTDSSADHALGDAVSSFKFTGTVELRALGFKEDDVKTLAQNLLLQEASSLESVDMTLSYGTLRINDARTLAAFSYEAKDMLRTPIDTKALTHAILGKNTDEIKQLLSTDTAIESLKISLWPFWVTSVPKNSAKVSVAID
ncbi:MAG: hypothetical protein KGI50_02165 [Patescibacteria group bacterium]|nr:hypothetical protein [Patescibacteria group bacterium]MDE2437849.1 hypothetical protein [Patescibacteria group bacterium]